MERDKFSATWVSHSSIADFLACPRAYYLKNVYKSPKTGRKMQLITPALALGSAVHEVVESLSVLPVDKRFKTSLLDRLDQSWKKFTGEKGGFHSVQQETEYLEAGKDMLRRVTQNPGPVGELAVKIKTDLPYYWMTEEDDIILCGKIDWLRYEPEEDSVHIIDFKTGKREVADDSLQLPIYYLLVKNTQGREVSGASYWYLRLYDNPSEQDLPDLQQAHDEVLAIAKKIHLARKLERFPCAQETGCRHCQPFEAILEGKATHVGVSEYRQDVFVLDDMSSSGEMESEIL